MILAALLLLAAQDAAAAKPLRELSTDRPDKTESPHTVDAGHVQLELDFAKWAADRNGPERTRTLTLAPVNLKLGIGRDTDVQLVFDGHIRERTEDRLTGARRTIDGAGDVTLRLKHNLWGNDGGSTAFALMPFVKLPTASNGLGNGHVEGGIIAPLAVTITDGIDLGLMTEVDVVRKDDDSGYTAAFINSATVAFDLTEQLGLYTEIYSERSAERGAGFVATFDAGLTYAVGEDTQLDLGVNVGLTDAADDLELFVGLSRRF